VLRRSIPAVIVLALGVAAPQAWANPTAIFRAGVLTVTLPDARDVATLRVAGSNIRLNNVDVAGATVTSTAVINVIVTTSGGARFVLDQGGGVFADAGGEIPVTVNGGAGIDEVAIGGVAGNDTITVGGTGIRLNGDVDRDVTFGPSVDFVDVSGGGGADTITAMGGGTAGGASSRPVRFIGGSGNDTLTGSTPPDALFGDAGEDELTGGNGADLMRGGADNDLLNGGLAADGLDGGPGNDRLSGGDGNDVLENSAGNDLLDGGGDVTIGQVGDRVQHEQMTPAGGVTLDLAVAGPQATGGAGTDTLVDIEDLGGTGFDDVLRGDGDDNVLDGRGGNDTIDGRAFQDTITGGSGNDVLVLGANMDTAIAGAGADFVNSVDGGFDNVDCGLDADTFTADPGDGLTGCEGAAGGGGGGGGGPAAGGAAPVLVPVTPAQRTDQLAITLTAPRTIKVRRGAVSFRLGCPANATGTCRATATLRAKVEKRTRKLGARGIVLDPGEEGAVKVKLTARGRRLLKSKRRLKSTIRVTARDDVGAAPTIDRKVTLKR
jgi:Ca2+-binding RTX toxin-like protein